MSEQQCRGLARWDPIADGMRAGIRPVDQFSARSLARPVVAAHRPFGVPQLSEVGNPYFAIISGLAHRSGGISAIVSGKLLHKRTSH